MHHLYRTQLLSCSLEEAWRFFVKPENLKVITPAFMGFDIQSVSGPRELHAGQIISYKVKPLLGIPLNWVTEITHVTEPCFFVDEQRWGPFLFWHHKHYLEMLPDGGVQMTDSVHYKVFYGLAGNLLNRWIVKKKLDAIFDHRQKVVGGMFNG